ncbi:TPA: hypothetical protein ACYLN4_008902, partial [Burkholderia lata]
MKNTEVECAAGRERKGPSTRNRYPDAFTAIGNECIFLCPVDRHMTPELQLSVETRLILSEDARCAPETQPER